MQLTDKVALVTGASRGIGRATAIALGRAGARVIVHYGQNAEAAAETVAEIQRAGAQAWAVGKDLSVSCAAHELVQEIRSISPDRLDIVIANAAISMDVPFENMSLEAFDQIFALNVRAPYFLIQQLLPMLGEGASIVLMSSLAASRVGANLSAYGATKGALEALTRHLAFSLGERGVRVNAIAPGVVDTDMSSFTKHQAGRDFALGMQCFKRIAHPDDIADVAVSLASDATRWITGQIVAVDGGSIC